MTTYAGSARVPPEWEPIHPRPTPPPPPGERPRPTMPMIVESDRDDVAAQLLDRRVVVITGRLDDALATRAAMQLLLLGQRSAGPITVHLCCPDADLDAALSLAATVDYLRSPLTVIATGAVNGAALAFYAAATTRHAHPHALFALTDPRTDLQVDARHVGDAADHHQRLVTTLHERVATACGRPTADVAHDFRDGRLLTATDAVTYGLVQTVTGGGGPAATSSRGRARPGPP